jgi:hypothetical protein
VQYAELSPNISPPPADCHRIFHLLLQTVTEYFTSTCRLSPNISPPRADCHRIFHLHLQTVTEYFTSSCRLSPNISPPRADCHRIFHLHVQTVTKYFTLLLHCSFMYFKIFGFASILHRSGNFVLNKHVE